MAIAVYTTIYPGVEPYLPDWYRSLRAQTDQDFELWIGLDTLDSREVQHMLGGSIQAHWVKALPGSTPAQVRQQALDAIVETCPAVILVDSDDVLHPTRVAAARARLEHGELVGCALRLIDREGTDLGVVFSLPEKQAAEAVFPRNNVFGFSNSAFHCDLLRRCLPIPASAVAVDWFLATRAWLLGARLDFDPVPRMDYRQYPANTARVCFPVAANQIGSDTALVRRHFQLLLSQPDREFLPERHAAVRVIADEVEEFNRAVVSQPSCLDAYVEAFNQLRPAPLWWFCVAHPALARMWSISN